MRLGRAVNLRAIAVGLLAGTFLLLGLALLPPPAAGAAAVGSQCVTCHTDPARLQALTPPDPPSAEEGEG